MKQKTLFEQLNEICLSKIFNLILPIKWNATCMNAIGRTVVMVFEYEPCENSY